MKKCFEDPADKVKAALAVVKIAETTPEQLESNAGLDVAIDRLLARHPNAGTGLLDRLSHSSDKITRRYVVTHPNAPKDVLVKLAHQFPTEFFKNPAFDWLLLEDPDLLTRIGGNVLGTLLKRTDCPQSFLRWAVIHGTEKERLAVAMNPDAPVETLLELAAQGGKVAESASRHANIKGACDPEDPAARFESEVRMKLGQISSQTVADCWKRGFIGTAQWLSLSFRGRLHVLGIDVALIENRLFSSADGIWLEQLAKDSKARLKVAAHSACTIELLEQLAGDPDEDVRGSVAENPNCPVSLLEQLAKDKDGAVRGAVAKNPTCPEELLKQLAKDNNEYCRSFVASNPACPEVLLKELAKEKGWEVRDAVAQNPKCPVELLERLAKGKGEENEMVRSAVAENLNCPVGLLERLAKGKHSWSRRAVGKNPTCPLALLEQLAKDKDGGVRGAVAANPHCLIVLLEQLVKDKDLRVRRAVSTNPGCPVRLLEQLALDRDLDVRHAVASNPACPEALLLTLARRKDIRLALISKGTRLHALPEKLLLELADEAGKMFGTLDFSACPSNLREVLGARSWRSMIMLLASRHDKPSQITEHLNAIDNQALVEAFAAECAALLLEPQRSLLARVIGANELASVLTMPNECADSAARHRQSAIRLLGLHHSHTAPATLAKKASSTEWAERLAIAGNPSCPSGVLERLKIDPNHLVAAMAQLGIDRKSLAEVRRNKNLEVSTTIEISLMVAEIRLRFESKGSLLNFDRCAQLSHSCWATSIAFVKMVEPQAFASYRYIPFEFLEQLAKELDPSIRRAVAGNERCPRVLLEKLAKDKAENVRWGVAQNPKCPEELLERLAKDKSENVRSMVAKNPACPESLLELLAKDENVRLDMAKNSACPESLLECLAKDKSEYARSCVAQNPACPVELLGLLSTDKAEVVRRQVAENSACTVPLLQRLSKDKSKDVRRQVAANPVCPVDQLEQLATDQDLWVRGRVGAHPACPIVVLEQLAKDQDLNVRRSVAANPVCSVALLERLAASGDLDVRRMVAANTACPVTLLEQLAKDDDSDVRRMVASNNKCPVVLLELLATDQHCYVRGAVAANPACSVALLEQLSEDRENSVRWKVASNTVCSVALLEKMTGDNNWDVQLAVIQHPDCSSLTLTRLINHGSPWAAFLAIHHPNATTDQLLCWATDDGLHPALRLAAASHPLFPPSAGAVAERIQDLLMAPPPLDEVADADWILAFEALGLYPEPEKDKEIAKAAKSKDWLQRAAATFSPRIQPNQLKLLLDDEEEIVRQLASKRIREVN